MKVMLVTSGESVQFEWDDVALEGDNPSTITDDEIKARLARYHDQAENHYDNYVVDRHPGEDGSTSFVVRKRAVYG